MTIFPMRTPICRFRNANGRAVNPSDALGVRIIRAAVCVKHPPPLQVRIPDHARVRRAVMDRIAKQRLGRHRVIRRSTNGQRDTANEQKN